MEVDTIHGIIERKRKTTNMEIEIPTDWMKFMKSIEGKPKLRVYEMEKFEFYNFRNLLESHYIHAKSTVEKKRCNGEVKLECDTFNF